MSSRRCNVQRQVIDSELVKTSSRLRQLATLLEVDASSLKLTTLFNTRSNGWSPPTFHSLCDSKGPTLTIAQGPSGLCFGAYTSVSWTSSAQFADDAKAFLFRCHSTTEEPEKFHRNGNGGEIYNHRNYGPTFGKKFDFFTFDTSGVTQYKRHSYSSLISNSPHSFAIQGPLVNTKCAKKDKSFQLEVLQVSDFDSAQGECEEPWLPGISWTDKVTPAL